MSELDRLRYLEILVRHWARLHAAHYAPTVMYAPDKVPHVTRRDYLAAEQALLNAVKS